MALDAPSRWSPLPTRKVAEGCGRLRKVKKYFHSTGNPGHQSGFPLTARQRRIDCDCLMFCVPLIERELRVALRKRRPVRGRLKVAALAVGGSVLFLLLAALTGDRGAGQTLERFLYLAGLAFVVRSPMLIAGALAEERQNQTLGLLFLSGLGAGEVFASKFLSSALIAFTNLLAIFPMLALPFLIGGVSYDMFVAILCALPALMLFALAISLLASVLTRDDGAAVILANVLGVTLCLLTPAIYLAQSQFAPAAKVSLWWLRVSPAYGPFLIWRGFNSGFHGADQAEFWRSLALTLGWSMFALGAAVFALKRLWRGWEDEEQAGRWSKWWREFLRGGKASRDCLARSWLDENPFVWLAARNRQPAMMGWLVVGGLVLVWLLCWAIWPVQWPSVLNFFITAALLNAALSWLTRYAAAQEIGQARRDGAYELLLTTSLNPDEIVHGVLDALRLRFQAMANFVLSLNVLLMLAGLLARSWTTSALFVYFAIWLILLTWTWRLGHYWSRLVLVMWTSLNCGRPAYAAWCASNSGSGGFRWWYWMWIWNLYTMHITGRGFKQFPSGSLGEVVFACFVALIWVIWFVGTLVGRRRKADDYVWNQHEKAWVPVGVSRGNALDRGYERRLIGEFREIVREPLPERNDPRFKKWNVRERFPQNWGVVQDQLHERFARKLSEPM